MSWGKGGQRRYDLSYVRRSGENASGDQYHRIPVGAGFAGLLFAVGMCLEFLVGIPALRWFLLGAVVIGAAIGGVLWRRHKNRPLEITDIHRIVE